jgi:2'-hydroxyisoflavone reductase
MRPIRRKILKVMMSALPAMVAPWRSTWAAAGSSIPGKPMRILILGGTGFTGPHQVRYALARGHKVTLFNRGKQPQEWTGEVEELIGDRNTGDLKALEGRDWDVCIDNPTTLPFWVRDAGQMLRNKVRQYIFISTISVYAKNDKPEDESAAVLSYSGKDAMLETQDTLRASAGELYGPLKASSEAECQKQFPGITTIIRPGLIVGPGDPSDRFTYWPVRLAQGGEVLAPGDGTDPVQLIDARDLAEWTIRVAESRTLGTFNATGPARRLSVHEMLTGIAMAIQSKCTFTYLPTSFLESEKVSPWSDMPVWIPGQGDTAGFARRNIGRALRAGLSFRPLSTTSLDTLEWFKRQPAERQEKLKAGIPLSREAQLLANWKARSNNHS